MQHDALKALLTSLLSSECRRGFISDDEFFGFVSQLRSASTSDDISNIASEIYTLFEDRLGG
jgi:hypothetical protein